MTSIDFPGRFRENHWTSARRLLIGSPAGDLDFGQWAAVDLPGAPGARRSRRSTILVLRRMKPRRLTAAVATGVLAVTGVLVAVSPAANATVVKYTSLCVNDFVGPVGEVPSEYDVTVSPVKDKYTVGDVVTVNWKWVAFPKVPLSSPIPTLPENSTKPFGDVGVTGAQTEVVQVTGPQEHPPANAGEELKVPDMTGTFTLTAPGTLTLAPKGYKTVSTVFGIQSVTTCQPVAGQVPGDVATLTVEGAQTADPVLNGPAESHRGFEIDLTGSNFAPSAVPQLSLCAPDGSNCSASSFTANTLAIDGQGKLTGKATLAPSGIPDGAYAVRVSDGTKAALSPLAITPYVSPTPRDGAVNPAAAGVGDVVTVSGTGWTPNSNVSITPMNAAGSGVASSANAFTDATGKFSTQVTITSADTAQFRLRDGADTSLRVFVPFTVRTVPTGEQYPTVTLASGPLSMSQAGDGIDFGSATLNGEAQTLQANLNQVTILDARGGKLGWSLTGTMTDLVAANGTDKIPAGNVAWTPSCAATPGSLSEVANGSPGALGSSPAALCSQAPGTTTTGGKFTADAQVTLTTPQFAAAGTYTGTLTLTLI
ncbi:hypothetical protein [Streptodolium elevatio]